MKKILLAGLILLVSSFGAIAIPPVTTSPDTAIKPDGMSTFFDKQLVGPLWWVVGLHFTKKGETKRYMSTCSLLTIFKSQMTKKPVLVGLNVRVSDLDADEKAKPQWYMNFISDGFRSLPNKFTTPFAWQKYSGQRYYVNAEIFKSSPIMMLFINLPMNFINEVFSGYSQYIELELPHDPNRNSRIRLNMVDTETALDMLKFCTVSYKKQFIMKK